MRIVAGIYRGRAICAPDNGRATTRPTTDRTREALASMLMAARGLDLSGDHVLDAFAGSGAIAFELLSRGAAQATVVEKAAQPLRALRSTAQALGLTSEQLSIVKQDVLQLAHQTQRGPFSIVVLDPPYALSAAVVSAFVVSLLDAGMLSADALVLYERDATRPSLELPGFMLEKEKTHGGTALELYRLVQ